MLSGTIRWVVLDNLSPIVLMFLFRDGDVVAIRASADGEELVIKDNHPLDALTPPKSGGSEAASLD